MAATTDPSPISLIATAAFGLEAVVAREIEALGYTSRTIQPGRLMVTADLPALCRLNLHLRCAERVLVCIGQFEADDFGKLFDGVAALPWEDWIPPDGQFPVRGRSIKSQLSSVPACQRMVKKAVATRLLDAHRVPVLEETGPIYQIEVALLNNLVTLTIDTSGAGLHKRGYRPISGRAPLRETLAAAMVQLSFWKPDRPLIDPFCGTGTIPIEAAMIGRCIAPGLNREFAAESWPVLEPSVWAAARESARSLIVEDLPVRIRGMDNHEGALGLARLNASAANVADDIHFQNKPFRDLSSKREFGCLITNPPYGLRMGEEREMQELYRSMPEVFRRLPTWSHYVITAFPGFEKTIGQSANRRRKRYNGRIQCQYFQFHGPRPGGDNRTHFEQPDAQPTGPAQPIDPAQPTDPGQPVIEEHCDTHDMPALIASGGDAAANTTSLANVEPKPAFGGLREEAKRQATEFGNRLRKRARHLRKWPTRGITCYRLYERDIPEIPLVVDRYEDRLHIAEFSRPHERTPAEHADWLDLMKRTAADILDVRPANVAMKYRDRQRGSSQYERVAKRRERIIAHEGGLRFVVNLTDYLDTGLFLDHRITRGMVRELATGKRVLNLFGYTGSFSVYAADGGATSTTTVDLSSTYLDWAAENMKINGFEGDHRRVPSDVLPFLKGLAADEKFDLVVVDPPTFSNSKRTTRDWDIQRDHAELLGELTNHINPDGIVFFSTNFRRFKFQESSLSDWTVREITGKTVPPDFRNRRIHRCWKLLRNP